MRLLTFTCALHLMAVSKSGLRKSGLLRDSIKPVGGPLAWSTWPNIVRSRSRSHLCLTMHLPDLTRWLHRMRKSSLEALKGTTGALSQWTKETQVARAPWMAKSVFVEGATSPAQAHCFKEVFVIPLSAGVAGCAS